MKLKLSLILLVFFSGFGFAQETKTVTGTVIDQNDVPLSGAQVKVIDKEIFSVADFDGNFSLENVEVGDVFQVTFLGFKAQNVEVTQQDSYQINMVEDAGQLDEVVVVGYGTQSKQDVTGSISSVKSEEIIKQPSSTATQALQGKVSGVNIVNSAAPGATPTVTIRGLGTALGGRNPLYVVDGVPVSDIQNISPGNIESIDFLKDASSAAIYGVRAANGVIIVTTKKGKSGKAKFGIRSYYGAKPTLNPVKMANAEQYVTYFNEENDAIGGDRLSQDQRYDTDWYDEVTHIGSVNNTSFDVSGGSENIDYFFSYDYYEEEGLLIGQKFRRSTITNNNTYKLFDNRLKITQNLNLAFRDETPKPFGIFNTAFRQSPLVPVFYENGRYGGAYYNRTTGEATYIAGSDESIGNLTSHGNPVAALNFSNEKNKSFNIQGSVTAELEITEDFIFTSRFGARKIFVRSRSFNPNKARYLANDPTRTEEQFEGLKKDNPENTQYANNSLRFNSRESFKYNWDNFINYKKSFEDHSLDVTLGGSKEQIGIGMTDSYTAYDVPEASQYWSIKHATDQYDKQVNQFSYTPTNFLSYFGRLQYNYARKYYLTGTIRRDGSSTFQNNSDYWGTFPAVGVGWTLSRENFLEGNEVVNFLKLRGSWGKLGNANVPLNTTQILTDPDSGSQNYVLGPDQDLVFGAYIGSLARNLSWEVVEELSVGLDYELIDNRLSGSLDYYRRNTENTILEVQPLLNSTFANRFFDHGAEVINEGVEFAVNWSDQIGDKFSYNVGANFSYNHNEVSNVQRNYDGQLGGSTGLGGVSTKRLEEGQPLGSWWMYDVEGVWQSQEQIDNNASLGGARPGHLRYIDQNDDGAIDERDKVFLGTYIPSYNYGINISLSYDNFDFSVDGYGVGGNKVFNGLKNARIGGENITADTFNNRWTGEGSTNSNPGADRDIQASSYYLENGDFFRINNITLGYTLPSFSNFIDNVRVYVSAQNPILITEYSGFTPEISGYNPDNSNAQGPYGRSGLELDAYPLSSTFLVGVNIKL
ncbi:TonB-linked outer membrane protein, SusC/RagA family [Salegentibacter echinorum]|uniref:TonB-linked outer membrane protein, SusC/RagA family n=1 Tax=Salegentibacter echinorum TaxID=1073325 RepID=A0A1M5GEQ1_SALEC|nr:TonB-dependent receptor [Salegentibacter echinorum]SHG02176.1 TonB-linked outer membrane protein, SusC/RagA family [Salegentibacter echinorum]